MSTAARAQKTQPIRPPTPPREKEMQMIRVALLAAPAILVFIFLVDIFEGKDKEVARYEDEIPRVDDTSHVQALPIAQPSTPYIAPPAGEPSGADLRRLEFQVYDEINKAGGMTFTLPTNGATRTVRPTLYSVRKTSCKRLPNTPDKYECGLIILLSLEDDGSDPSEQGARIFVQWDGSRGEWTRY